MLARLAVIVVTLGVAATTIFSERSFSQSYPTKAIRILTSNAGGGSDFTARRIAQEISGPLGQPVIVDNRSAVLSTEAAYKSPPDGYTLLVNGGSLWINPILGRASYDPMKNFSPVLLTDRTVNIIAVHPSLPVSSVKDLIALAKARPGELNYASASVGGPTHLAAELFKNMAHVNIVHVPYKGTVAALTALITGEVQMTVIDVGSAAPHMTSGKLKALAVTSAQPSTLAPNLPTVAATGLPGYESIGVTGVWAPGETPPAIINRLNQEIVRYLSTPAAKQQFLNTGVEVVASSPEQFAAFIKTEISRTVKLINDAKLKFD